MPEVNFRKKFQNFIVVNLVAAALLIGLWFGLRSTGGFAITSAATPWIILLFLVTHLLLFHYQLKATTKRFSGFVNIFLLTTTGKLLLFLTIIIIYSLLHRQQAIVFILNFFVVYLVFTIIEVVKIFQAQNSLKSFLNK